MALIRLLANDPLPGVPAGEALGHSGTIVRGCVIDNYDLWLHPVLRKRALPTAPGKNRP